MSMTSPATRFIHLCGDMEGLLKQRRPGATWKAFEAEGLELLRGGAHIDRHILKPAFIHSGSMRLARLAWELAGEDSFQSFLETCPTIIPPHALRHATEDDLIWLKQIGIRPALPGLVFARDDPGFIDFAVSKMGYTEDGLLRAAIDTNRKPVLPQAFGLAGRLAAFLRRQREIEDGREFLAGLLETALLADDLRSISALLSLGMKFDLDDPAEDLTSQPLLLDLLEKNRSHHGRLGLMALEPDTASILSRDDGASFHGIASEMLG